MQRKLYVTKINVKNLRGFFNRADLRKYIFVINVADHLVPAFPFNIIYDKITKDISASAYIFHHV